MNDQLYFKFCELYVVLAGDEWLTHVIELKWDRLVEYQTGG